MAELFEEGFIEEDTLHGRYLTFTLEDNTYGIPIRYVTEIIGIQNVTEVPETPDFIKGIINLRGKIVPLIDVRLKFGKEEIPYTERTCIIVVDINSAQVGLIVDKVDDVMTIDDEEIALPPPDRVGFENRYIDGIGKAKDTVQLLLNTEKLLKNEEITVVERLAFSEDASLIE
jgi:purine-binding chemotaxis protein CheW